MSEDDLKDEVVPNEAKDPVEVYHWQKGNTRYVAL